MISAVNGDLWLDNIYCFRYRVKLNNPLMGTETIVRHDDIITLSWVWVLN